MRSGGLFGVVLVLLASAALAQGPDAPQGAPMPSRGSAPPAAIPAPSPSPSPSVPPANQVQRNAAELVAAARAGDANAQLTVGFAQLAVKPPNYSEALRWFRLSADQGNAQALNQLGRAYENGQGVPQDYAEALRWYRAAVAKNDAAAQSNLGAMYALGRGVPMDPGEAVRLFRLAADQGNPVGQANLGMQYLAGKGVAQNDAAAYFWLNLAAARVPAALGQVREQSARGRDIAAARLPPVELEHMQRLAAAWKPGSRDVPGETTPAGRPPGATPAAARPPGVPSGRRSTGTGFVVSPSGIVLTNNHVVTQCLEIHARHNTNPLGTVSVVATDAQNDLALLKLPARFPDAAVFREERGVRQGDAVVVYGFPLAGGLAASGNLTTGTISALAGLGNDSRLLQVSAPVQPGNSGGPLLDAGGNVLGIVTGQLNALRVAATVGNVPQNVNFAIKASVARTFLDANAVDYRTAALAQELKPADVGDRAKKFTLFIECVK